MPVNKTIRVTFSEYVQRGDNYNRITLRDGENKDVAFTKQLSGNSLVIDPTGNLKYGTLYEVRIPAGAVEDTEGNELEEAYAFRFRTVYTSTVTPAAVPTFSDVNGHWAAGCIKRLSELGLVYGYQDGTFRPDNKITRLEAACMLARLMNVPAGGESDLQRFKDAASIPEWARTTLAGAARDRLVYGYPHRDGSLTFEPYKLITRAEEAALMSRILEQKFGTLTPAYLAFRDSNRIPAWAKRAVGIAVAKGIVTGYPDYTIRPQNYVTRAEVACMILRLLGQFQIS
ncbi:MAG: S-layer homology domain-containing protein [Bacillota bacterium]